MANSPLECVTIPCPECGREVELFSDEPKRTCHCGHVVMRETVPRCADWCPAAAQCFGEAVDSRVLKKRLAEVKNDPKAAECVRTIRELLERKNRGEQSK